ncbi:MFS family permease [Kibdelosporangium banguiense]|uniref:MFS family permease n=1 Tax=Kibdelosporangium banguiense TaxID=1365924 RepID=A0ABS4TB62_9PSEU|nr:hypothetical protein [Kibdelosporangium banguiense]MBP2321655.1 MFS family permease [Kibdelosporangium banguiense]
MSSTGNAEFNGHGEGARSRLKRLLPVAVMLALVGLAAALPMIRNTIFYYWDDTAGATVPVWRRIGAAVLDGRLPIMEPDMWRGGAFAAEASTGIFNPVMVLLAVATYPIDNMALAITIAKIFFLLVMALGSYLLARAYGVRPWLAAGMGLAVPLATQTFYWDASSWMYSLMATAFIPWVWWTMHRAVHSGGSWLWVIIAGYLCVSLGNPYGLLAVGVIVLGFVVESWVTRKRDRILGLFVSGGAIGLLSVPVFLPLLLSSSVGFRAESETWNDEFLSPNLSSLLGLSTPTAQPWVSSFGTSHLFIPALYLAWFVLPVLPWLRWRMLRQRWQSMITVFVVGAVYLLLVLGPSQIWMFRWPLRLVTNLWFPVLLIWFVLANAGLERTKVKMRAAISLAVIFLGGWVAWADVPDNRDQIIAGCVVVAVLVALLVWRGMASKSGVAVLMAGSVAVLGVQLAYFPAMAGVTNYQFPTSQQLLKDRFKKYEGVTVQVASTTSLTGKQLLPNVAYKDVLFGSMYSVAGVSSPTDYSGIGFTKLDNKLCMIYQGSVCPDAWTALWKPVDGYTAPLADLMRAQTVVVQNNMVDTRKDPAPAGWRRDRSAEATGLTTVYKRIDPLPFNGTVSQASVGTQVAESVKTSTVGERTTFTRSNGNANGAVTFARLNWPGYTATVNGQPATIRTNAVGLIVVDLPKGVTSGTIELDFTMPGTGIAFVSVGIGLLLTIGLIGFSAYSRRRRPQDNGEPDLDTSQLAELEVPDTVSVSRES